MNRYEYKLVVLRTSITQAQAQLEEYVADGWQPMSLVSVGPQVWCLMIHAAAVEIEEM